ncbi:MAG TPA: M23 family metallopeptidase [Xanthobacteraceae bacterium]|nr:M23 family metallopeptidase [Xanthobacteraceae bacterium]
MSQRRAAAGPLPQRTPDSTYRSYESAHQAEPPRRGVRHASKHNGPTSAARRHVRIRPAVFWVGAAALVIMGGWSLATAAYFAFHDDVIKGMIARQLSQDFAYEDRIAELRTQIDRTTSRQVLSQDQIKQKVDELARRQAALESRTDALSGLADPGVTGTIRSGIRGGTEPASKLAPLGDVIPSPQRPDNGKQSSLEEKLDRIASSLDRVEGRQTAALEQIGARYEGRTRQVRSVLDALGLKFNAIPSATGGPFVPVKMPPASQSFARALTQANIARARAEDLANTLTFVPLRKPLTGELDMSSPFGVRVDPFVHEASMHTGMDFRGNIGDPIHATAAGKVVKAGWEGGYGQMVEIDHGEGLTSRYGHLSEIDVWVGQKVHVGDVVGRMGSTGRSTGPHLHYETRINGEAVNPEKFLAAGATLFGDKPIARSDRSSAQD